MGKKIRLVILLLMLIGVSVLGFREYRKRYPPEVFSIPPKGGESLSIQLSKKPIYLQTDPPWGGDKIGGSGEFMSSVGCTVSSISMGLAEFGLDLPPGKLNEALKSHDGYTSEGWLKWGAISEVTGGQVAFEIPAQPSYQAIDEALKHKSPVVANITMNGNFLHWVLIVGKSGQEYLIKDPLGNRTLEPLSKFNSPIYAIRIMKKS